MPVLLLVVVVLIAALCAAEARQRRNSAVVAFLLQLLGGLGPGIGVLALLFDGYVMDRDGPAAETSGLAAATLAAGALVTAGAWYFALRRRSRRRPQHRR